MGKIVLLDLVEGNFDRGFTVTLRIETEVERRCIVLTKGKLPQSPEIRDHYELWKSAYLARVDPMRSATRIGGYTSPNPGIKEIETHTRKLESNINKWLNSHHMSPIRDELLSELTDPREEIRFIFKTENQNLQRLPWHSWDIFHRKNCAKASVSLFMPVRKQPPIPREKVKVLAVFGKKETVGNTTIIKTDKDWESLYNFLSKDSNGEIIRLDEPTCEKLGEEIEKQSPQIFFFAGHSSSEDDAARGVIELNQDESITIDHLRHDIAGAVKHGLQLAIFNSCDGLGIAQQLSNLGVPNIIVMREIVPDEVAQKFLQRFLEAFVAGNSVSLAVRKAREKLNRLENRFPGVTFLPVSFQNPAEAPLTWQALGGVATRRAEQSQKGNENSILWLPSAIVNPSHEQQNQPSHTIIISSPQEEQELPAPGNNSSELEQRQAPATNIHSSQSRPQPPSPVAHSFESQPQQQTRHKISILRCSKGHENPAENNFCIHCRESLKQLPVSGVNSYSPQPQQSQLNALENQSVASVNSFSSQPQHSQLNVLGNQSTPLVKSFVNNRYQVLKSIGSGGFGETFLAEDTHMPSGRRCVVKKLHPVSHHPQIYPLIKERFQREAAILEDLGSHSDRIPTLYAYFEENNDFYLVQELIEGVTLTNIIQSQSSFSESYVRDFLVNFLPILDYVHQKHIIHRDIKPDNIIIRQSDQKPVLIDFGAVKEAVVTTVSSSGSTQTSIAIGTRGFMSCEQAAGRPVYSSDLFATGLTAIYLLTGKNPQDLEIDGYTGEILWKQYAPKISPTLVVILDKAISAQARDRYTTAREMLQALQSKHLNFIKRLLG